MFPLIYFGVIGMSLYLSAFILDVLKVICTCHMYFGFKITFLCRIDIVIFSLVIQCIDGEQVKLLFHVNKNVFCIKINWKNLIDYLARTVYSDLTVHRPQLRSDTIPLSQRKKLSFLFDYANSNPFIIYNELVNVTYCHAHPAFILTQNLWRYN